jgi:hypothetical protein
MGQSPLLSGSLTWAAVGLQRDLSDATSFMVQRIGDVLGYELSGADWHLSSPIFSAVSGPASLSDPFQKDCFCSGVNYLDATYTAKLGETFTQTLQPIAIPEPATWAMLILGFAAVGAGLRRRRAWGAAALA